MAMLKPNSSENMPIKRCCKKRNFNLPETKSKEFEKLSLQFSTKIESVLIKSIFIKKIPNNAKPLIKSISVMRGLSFINVINFTKDIKFVCGYAALGMATKACKQISQACLLRNDKTILLVGDNTYKGGECFTDILKFGAIYLLRVYILNRVLYPNLNGSRRYRLLVFCKRPDNNRYRK